MLVMMQGCGRSFLSAVSSPGRLFYYARVQADTSRVIGVTSDIIIDIAHTTRVQRERKIKDDRLKNRKTI